MPIGDNEVVVQVVDLVAVVGTQILDDEGAGNDGDDAKEVAVAVVVGSHNTGDVSDRDAVAAAVVEEEEEEICLVGDLLHETVCPFHGVVAEVVVVEEVIAHWMLWSTTTLSEAIGSLLKKVQGITDQSSSQ